MSKTWPEVKLGEVLRPTNRQTTLDSSQEYRLLGVRLDGYGPFLREKKLGSQISANTLYKVKNGDFIYSRLFAWRGAFGVICNDLDSCFVSNEFPVFTAQKEQLNVNFLKYWFRLPHILKQVEADCTGSTPLTRNRYKESFFLNLKIPLPPLAEQQRIVEKIERLAGKIEEARELRKPAVEESELLLNRAATELIDEAGWNTIPLGELLTESPRNGLSPKPEVEIGGKPMLRINSVSSSPTRFVDLTAVKHVEVTDKEAEPFILQNNDVFIVRYNGDINRVAKPAIYKAIDECRTAFPDKLMRLRPNLKKMLPDFLVFALNTKSIRRQIEKIGKTTAGNIGISGSNVKSFIIAVPPLSEQNLIVSKLDQLQKKMDDIKAIQSQTAVELDALLPSILDKAFKGEL